MRGVCLGYIGKGTHDRPLKLKGGHFPFLLLISHINQPAPPIAKTIITPKIKSQRSLKKIPTKNPMPPKMSAAMSNLFVLVFMKELYTGCLRNKS